ncbi:hypothetical protein BDN72DRAFT_842688 [Pluteus cervinus]|uniref:Uncharacterized protein n=1 Tax=Pluteus cervinus TaxID=181527 RepID=A0ACD3APT9_9AGAR|nr:hypothetical protein BDN72DRAFT_842688 [Pluteus cervinus]
METLPPALRLGATESQYEAAGEMSQVPDLLWPKPHYKDGDIMPPVLQFGIHLKRATINSFFKRYSRADVEPTIKKHDLNDDIVLGREVCSVAANLNRDYVDVLAFWTTYTGGKDRVLSEEEKKLCEEFEAQPMWYLDANWHFWSRQRGG